MSKPLTPWIRCLSSLIALVLLTALKTLPDPIYTIWDVQGRIAQILARLGVTEAIPVVIEHLHLTNWGVNHRYRCYPPALAIYGQGAHAALPVLREGLTKNLDDKHKKIVKDAIKKIETEPMSKPDTGKRATLKPRASARTPFVAKSPRRSSSAAA